MESKVMICVVVGDLDLAQPHPLIMTALEDRDLIDTVLKGSSRNHSHSCSDYELIWPQVA